MNCAKRKSKRCWITARVWMAFPTESTTERAQVTITVSLPHQRTLVGFFKGFPPITISEIF